MMGLCTPSINTYTTQSGGNGAFRAVLCLNNGTLNPLGHYRQKSTPVCPTELQRGQTHFIFSVYDALKVRDASNFQVTYGGLFVIPDCNFKPRFLLLHLAESSPRESSLMSFYTVAATSITWNIEKLGIYILEMVI